MMTIHVLLQTRFVSLSHTHTYTHVLQAIPIVMDLASIPSPGREIWRLRILATGLANTGM